jgi:hypothetical protein
MGSSCDVVQLYHVASKVLGVSGFSGAVDSLGEDPFANLVEQELLVVEGGGVGGLVDAADEGGFG